MSLAERNAAARLRQAEHERDEATELTATAQATLAKVWRELRRREFAIASVEALLSGCLSEDQHLVSVEAVTVALQLPSREKPL